MRQSPDFRFQLRAPKSLHLLESCTYIYRVCSPYVSTGPSVLEVFNNLLRHLRISIDRLEGVQCLVSSLDPDQELVESVLELAKSEQSVLQLLLSDHDGLVEVAPPPVDLGQGLLDSSSLVGGSFLRKIVSLPKEKTIKEKRSQHYTAEKISFLHHFQKGVIAC